MKTRNYIEHRSTCTSSDRWQVRLKNIMLTKFFFFPPPSPNVMADWFTGTLPDASAPSLRTHIVIFLVFWWWIFFLATFLHIHHDSSVCIVTMQQAGLLRNCSVMVLTKGISVLLRIRNQFGTYQACLVGAGDSFPRSKVVWAWSWSPISMCCQG